MENKKPGLAVMIALKSAKKDKKDNRHADSARELLDAIKEDDAELFGELLKSYVESCVNESETAQPEEEE